jgi:hypothetical protein
LHGERGGTAVRPVSPERRASGWGSHNRIGAGLGTPPAHLARTGRAAGREGCGLDGVKWVGVSSHGGTTAERFERWVTKR